MTKIFLFELFKNHLLKILIAIFTIIYIASSFLWYYSPTKNLWISYSLIHYMITASVPIFFYQKFCDKHKKILTEIIIPHVQRLYIVWSSLSIAFFINFFVFLMYIFTIIYTGDIIYIRFFLSIFFTTFFACNIIVILSLIVNRYLFAVVLYYLLIAVMSITQNNKLALIHPYIVSSNYSNDFIFFKIVLASISFCILCYCSKKLYFCKPKNYHR